MKVERPPTLWEAETEVEPFLALLGQMIALGLGRGNELEDLTLSVSNVVVEPDGDDEEAEWIPAGEYVAITVRGAGAWNDDTWRAGRGPAMGPLRSLGPVADAAGAVCVYARDLAPEGSVTALLHRLVPPT
ncbi:MAG TPA: hypothetical protein VFM40_03065 [Actinomycetota bacterium]|nr:hypothetical protein [Actinomycetota bacterium]